MNIPAIMTRGGRFNQIRPLSWLLLNIGIITAFAGCTIDGAGFFNSKSTPDQRFAQSRQVADPTWSGLAPGDDYSFVFISDSHVYQQNTSRLAKLNAVLAADKFLVNGGDITQNGRAEDIRAYVDWTKTLAIPAYSAIGNHDLYFEGWDNVGPALGQSSYTLGIGPDLRLIILDTGNATLGNAQFKWLQAVLGRATEATIVAVSHHPLFSTGFSSFNLSDSEESTAIVQLFSHYGVKLALAGHTHVRSARAIGPTQYVVGEASRVEDSDQQAIRIRIQNGVVSASSFPLP